MAQPNYNRQGYVYVPGAEVGVSGLIGGPVLDIAANTALAPLVTGAIILDRVIIPAGAFDVAGQYITMLAMAVVVNNANSKTLAFNFGGTGAIGGAVTGGTTITTVTGTTVTNLLVEGIVMKTGASTQDLLSTLAQQGTTVSAPALATSTVSDTAGIQLNLIVNAATAASDITSVRWYAQFCL